MENSAIFPEDTGLRFPQDIISLGGVQVIRSSGELFNHVDAGLPMWSSDGDRLVRVEIEFCATFADVPMISLGLTGIDSAHDQNLRFWLREADVTEKGFSIEFSTWGDTHIARAAVSWSAIGEAYVKFSSPAARSLRGKRSS
ncbi:H-type lectin domain-containing protein [Paracoccus sp. (in: a-proteobacteria)]|uniref:H-type lectin domain-containing protein n=1 Tax=Paracoccus sp. TaxID=267 RepID=UPI0028B1038C|nr:H-type lectin domain-containing protein [Paracoccus sp. (in: a-proteobacteria)]